MPGLVRGDGQDEVNTVHPSIGGSSCDGSPDTIYTDECSDSVFVGDYGVVRLGDKVQMHTFPGCDMHDPALVVASSDIIIEGKGAAREGDTYACGAMIMTSSSDVVIG